MSSTKEFRVYQAGYRIASEIFEISRTPPPEELPHQSDLKLVPIDLPEPARSLSEAGDASSVDHMGNDRETKLSQPID